VFPSGWQDKQQAGAVDYPGKVRKDNEENLWTHRSGMGQRGKKTSAAPKVHKRHFQAQPLSSSQAGPRQYGEKSKMVSCFPIALRRHLETPVLVLKRSRAGKCE